MNKTARIAGWIVLLMLTGIAGAEVPTRDGGNDDPFGPSEPDDFARSDDPQIDRRPPLTPVGASCPAGHHLVHRSGAPGIQDPDTLPYRDSDYYCAPDEDPSTLSCSGHGIGVLVDGIAACSCDDGYGRADCSDCIAGYHREPTSGSCVPDPPASADEPVIDGTRESIEQGQTRRLSATSALDLTFVWEIQEGGGCFVNELSGGCGPSVTAPTALFQAPRAGDDVEFTRIKATPACCVGPSSSATIAWVPPGFIPITGYGDSRLRPIVRDVADFMRYRCVGAAVVGISRYGKPVGIWGLGRKNGRATFGADPACGGANDPYDQTAPLVDDDTPMGLGSISKSITAAVLRWTLVEKWKELDPAVQGLNQNKIEQLLLFGPNDFPGDLFPQDLHDLFAGVTAPPVLFSDQTGYDNTNVALCDDLDTFADAQWQQVRLRELLAHRSGMQRTPMSNVSQVTANLAALRDLQTEQDFKDQEQILIDEFGQQPIMDAKEDLQLNSGYFVPRTDLHDNLVALSGRCLRHPLGFGNYSNSSPWFWSTIIEQNIGSGRFAAGAGYPAEHAGSALQRFFQESLGYATTASSGIFNHQAAIDLPGYPYPQPNRRDWNAGAQSYYPSGWDNKRPHCEWDQGSCSFQGWVNATPGRINQSWLRARVPFELRGTGMNAPTGSLVAEPRAMLRFMANHWVSGYDNNPRIGEARKNTWDKWTRHNGALRGVLAWAMQIGSDGPKSWPLPPLDAFGNIQDDFANLQTYKCALPNGTEVSLPDGVDVFVAINQRGWTDSNGNEGGELKCINDGSYTCGTAYNLLDNFVLHGVCRIDWSLIMAPNIKMP